MFRLVSLSQLFNWESKCEVAINNIKWLHACACIITMTDNWGWKVEMTEWLKNVNIAMSQRRQWACTDSEYCLYPVWCVTIVLQETWSGTSPMRYLTLLFYKRMATSQRTWLPWWMGKHLLPTAVAAARLFQLSVVVGLKSLSFNKLCLWQLMRTLWTSRSCR